MIFIQIRRKIFLNEKKEGEKVSFSLNLERLDLIACMSEYFFSIWVNLGRGDSLPHQELHSEAS